jgi:hypothetical protein
VSQLQREKDDIVMLATSLAVVPLTWLILGWRWPLSVSGHDGLANVLVLLQVLGQTEGDWSRLAYRVDLLGGMKLRDAVGPFPVFTWLARVGFSPTTILDLTSFLLQSVIAFLGVRTAADLARSWSGRDVRPGFWLRLAGVWACGFAPVLGWKIGAGHQTLLTGMLPFLAGFALVVAAGAGTASATLVLVAAAALAGGILFTGHQMVVYGAIFGAPILAGAWWARGRRLRDLVLPAATGLGTILFVMPELWGVIAHAFSTDSLRALHGMRITYSYLTGQPLDWLGSLLWARDVLRPSVPQLLHHEVNNPMGPMLLLLALVPWSRARALGIGLAVSAAAALLFSMNAHPFSDALLLLLPPLGSFRVPTRAFLPALFALPILAMAGVVLTKLGGASGAPPRIRGATLARRVVYAGLALVSLRSTSRPPRPPARSAGMNPAALAAFAAAGRRALWAVLAAAVLYLLPPLPRELAGWAVAAAVTLHLPRLGRWPSVPAMAAFLVLAGGGLAAFRERVISFDGFPDGEALLARAHDVGNKARRAQPALASPLVRVSPSFEWPELLSNTAVAGGLSSLDGYYFPQRRLVELMCAARGQPFQPNSLLLRFPPERPSSRALFQLYNVAWRLDESGAVRPLGETAGPAWFASRLIRTESFLALGHELVALREGLAFQARRAAWLVDPDPMVARAGLLAAVDARCADARVEGVDRPGGVTVATARVLTPTDCPLTFAMNYAETLQATARMSDGRAQTAIVFPAYGALAGVWVPRGAAEVTVTARVPRPPLSALWRTLGAALLLWQTLYSPRQRRP